MRHPYSKHLVAFGITGFALAACGAPQDTKSTRQQTAGQETHHSIDEVPVARHDVGDSTSQDDAQGNALDGSAARNLLPDQLADTDHFIGGPRFASIEVVAGVDVRACANRIVADAKSHGRADIATNLTVGSANADGQTVKFKALTQCSVATVDAVNKALASTQRATWVVRYFVLADAK